MRRVFLFGIVASALAFIVVMIGQLLNLDLQNVLFGISAGAILGLVRTHSPVARMGAFLIGFVFGVASYGLRALVFPSTWLGNALTVVIIIMVLTTISALTRDRLPLWGMLLGAMAFVGSYNQYFSSTPWLFVSQSISTASGVLFSVAAGFLVTILVEVRVLRGGVDTVDPMQPESKDSAENRHDTALAETAAKKIAADEAAKKEPPVPATVAAPASAPEASSQVDSGLSVLTQPGTETSQAAVPPQEEK